MPTITPKITAFKNQDINQLYELTNSTINGLKTTEAVKRQAEYGANSLAKVKKNNLVWQFLSYFKNPLIIALLFAAVISGATGEEKNAAIIFAIILLSVILNFYQENKSNHAAEKISKQVALRADVKRNGTYQEIEAENIVPGDIISLRAGDIIPADGKIISCENLFVNEAALNGESFPAEKDKTSNSLLFSGTHVISGEAEFLAVLTGTKTEFGQIAQKIDIKDNENTFEKGIRDFGALILKIIALIIAIIFLINAGLKKDILDSFIFAIAVAVGVTPEMLPMIMSVNLAKGSIRMAKKGVLVKKLSAISDFGSMDILCTDKTGTLTQDRITLIKHLNPLGQDNEAVFERAYVNAYFETSIKSLLDKALLDYKKINTSTYQKIKEIPYDFERKRSSVVYQTAGQIWLATKGAPEEIFKICSSFQLNNQLKTLDKASLKKITDIYNQLSTDGLRVLAVATKSIKDGIKDYSAEEKDLVLEGFIAFYDPPKIEAKETLAFMKKHSVEIKILTGDSGLVTQKICRDLGLPTDNFISGIDFDSNISDEEIYKLVRNTTICARLTPAQKEKIISVLRQHNLTIGYLGDGINDAPSLKSADVGISVDNAVDVAKETADIILLKKGLRELMDGVIEGRKTFSNTMKYLLMGLSSNFGNMFSMIFASIYLPFFPMTAGQILLNNFIYDSSQLAIPSDNVDHEYLKKPKHWDMNFIKKFMLIFGPISSIFDIITFIILFGILHFNAEQFQAGWFIESIGTQVLVVYIIRTRLIPFKQSWPSRSLTISTLIAVAISLIIIFQPFAHLFGFEPLPLYVLAIIIVLVIVYLILVEMSKRLFYHYFDKKGEIV